MISVIIPIYKTPLALLERCIKSIKQQTINDYEVIMIDDGSRQPELTTALRSYLEDERFILLEQENLGVSATRNRGIAAAKGEYVTFVDADDSLTSSYFSRALQVIHETDADVVIGGIIMHEKGQIRKCAISSEVPIIFEGMRIRQIEDYMLSMCPVVDNTCLRGLRLRGPWGKLIKRAALEGVMFDTDMPVYEDTIFNIRLFQNINKLAVDPALYYHYFIAEGSAMRRYRPDGVREQKVLASALLNISKQTPALESACSVFMLTGIKKLILCTLYHSDRKNRTSYTELKRFLKSPSIVRLLGKISGIHLESLNFKDKLFVFMCRHSILLLHLLASSGVI